MTTEELNELLEGVTIPISRIEKELGIAPSVLNKAKKGDRNLPDKYIQPLKEYVEIYHTDIPKRSSELIGTPNTANQIGHNGNYPPQLLVLIDYCRDKDCTPLDLIEAHKEVNKPKIDPFQQYMDSIDGTTDLKELFKIKDNLRMDTTTITLAQYKELSTYCERAIAHVKSKQKSFTDYQSQILGYKEDYATEEDYIKLIAEINIQSHFTDKQKAFLVNYMKN